MHDELRYTVSQPVLVRLVVISKSETIIKNDHLELNRVSGIGRPFAVHRERLGPIPYPVPRLSIPGLGRLPAGTNPHRSRAEA